MKASIILITSAAVWGCCAYSTVTRSKENFDRKYKVIEDTNTQDQEDWGEMRGVPPRIRRISDALNAGYDVGFKALEELSDYMEKEQEAWDDWASKL